MTKKEIEQLGKLLIKFRDMIQEEIEVREVLERMKAPRKKYLSLSQMERFIKCKTKRRK